MDNRFYVGNKNIKNVCKKHKEDANNNVHYPHMNCTICSPNYQTARGCVLKNLSYVYPIAVLFHRNLNCFSDTFKLLHCNMQILNRRLSCICTINAMHKILKLRITNLSKIINSPSS